MKRFFPAPALSILFGLVFGLLAAAPAEAAADSDPPKPASSPGRAGLPSASSFNPSPASPASPFLKDSLLSYFSRSRIRGRLGFSVYSTRYGRFEARHDDTSFYTPASCLKLIVTAAVLDTFPVNFFPVTFLELHGQVKDRKFRGKVKVVGGGDPNVSGRFYPEPLSAFGAWTDSLKKMGIDTLEGSIEVADTFFIGPRRPEAWKPHHFNTWYGAEISALSYNDNTFILSVRPGARAGDPVAVSVYPEVRHVRIVNRAKTVKGGRGGISVRQDPESTVITLNGRLGVKSRGAQMILPVRNPTRYFQAAFETALARGGIAYRPGAEAERGAEGERLSPALKTFRFTTAPLVNVAEEVNQRSQNLHAELLLRHLGKLVKGEGSAAAGLRAEYDFIRRLGLDTAGFLLHDASGLSPHNRVKPASLSLFLARMARRPSGRDYIASLAQPGLDGATGRRLRAYTHMNLIRYKTGSINAVQGLSGYAFGNDGDTLAVSFFINGFSGSSERAALLLDSLFAKTALWFNKERPALLEAQKIFLRPDIPASYPQRLRYFSGALLGRPYFLGPTGEGRFGTVEPAPLADLHRFDCVTYIENVMALSASRTPAGYLEALLPLRYRSDTLSYAARNHFFVEDWLKDNHRLARLKRFPGDSLVKKPIAKTRFFESKGLPGPAADPIASIPMVPYEAALKLIEGWKEKDSFLGVAFATGIEGLDVTHTGFLVSGPAGKPMLRNASSLEDKVTDQDFLEYLKSRKGKCTGLVFFDFPEPPRGS